MTRARLETRRAGRPSAGALVDTYGRTVRDLRISITNRCSFRCTYCMPAEGLQWLARDEILSFEEIERISRLCVERFAIDGIRITGGEPTVRAELPKLVAMLAAIRRADGNSRRPRDDDQRRHAAAARSATTGRRPAADQHLLRLPAAGPFLRPSPGATGSRRCSTGSTRPCKPASRR
jgi:hypothetical protein